jgi:hypothetical protein
MYDVIKLSLALKMSYAVDLIDHSAVCPILNWVTAIEVKAIAQATLCEARKRAPFFPPTLCVSFAVMGAALCCKVGQFLQRTPG